MSKRLILVSTIFLIFIAKISFAQDLQNSVMEEYSILFQEKLIAIAKENYPRVKIHNGQIAVAKAAITNAKLGWLAPLSLSYVYSPANSLNVINPTFFSGYQIGFSVNLGAILQTPANVKQSKENYKVAGYNLDEYLLTLTTQVKTRYINYLQAKKHLKLNSQSNDDARSSLDLIKHRFEKGETTYEDYNRAVTGLNTSNQTKIDAEVSLLIAKASLEELLGIRLEEVPN